MTSPPLPPEQVAQLLHRAGFRGEDLVTMVAIGERESGYVPDAHRTNTDPEKMVGDFGLFQINYTNDTAAMRAAIGMTSRADLLDPEVNARAAFYLYQRGGLDPWAAGQGGWTADGSPTHGTDVEKAREAVARAEAAGMLDGTPEPGPTFEPPASPSGSSTSPATSTETAPAPPVDVPSASDPFEEAAANRNAPDTDLDMLPDHFEVKYELRPDEPDTDGDGITDGYELIMVGTDPRLADTDVDGISDGMELSLGLDPTLADGPGRDAVLGTPDELAGDSDGDGVSDLGEQRLGTDPFDVDTDRDGVFDGDELIARTDPLSADP